MISWDKIKHDAVGIMRIQIQELGVAVSNIEETTPYDHKFRKERQRIRDLCEKLAEVVNTL